MASTILSTTNMGWDFYLSIGCLVVGHILLTSMMLHNIKTSYEEHDQRVEARRQFKKVKNEKLRLFYGLPKRED